MLPLVHGVVAQMPAASAKRLAALKAVHAVSLNSRIVTDAATFDPGQLATWFNQDASTQNLWSHQAGAGVGVAVVDTGVDGNLPDFATSQSDSASRVIASAVVNPAARTANDTVGHGTMVASLIAGDGDARASADPFYGHYLGAAPAANIIAIKASDDQGNATVLDVLYAIQFAIDHRSEYNIRVLNLSLSSQSAQSYTTDPLDAAVESAWFDGIAVVVAAGNAGPGSVDYAPANDPYVITVGAVGDQQTMQHVAAEQQQRDAANEKSQQQQNAAAEQAITDPSQRAVQQQIDQQQFQAMQQGDSQQVQALQRAAGLPAPWSSSGTTQDGFAKPDVWAPGRFITADLAPGSEYAGSCSVCVVGNQYLTASGTSLAAPIVSGAVADLLAEHPGWTPAMVKGALVNTDQPIPGSSASSAGTLNANAAVGASSDKLRADQGLTPAAGADTSGGATSDDRSSWSRSSWSTTSGPLSAPWARSSWSCTCEAGGAGSVGATRSSWSSLAWTVDFSDVQSLY